MKMASVSHVFIQSPNWEHWEQNKTCICRAAASLMKDTCPLCTGNALRMLFVLLKKLMEKNMSRWFEGLEVNRGPGQINLRVIKGI